MKPNIKKAMAAAAARLVSESTNSITTPAYTAGYTAAAPALPALPGPDGGTGRGPLTAPEAVVVIIIILTAAGLALAGLPVAGVLALLSGSGAVAVGVLTRRIPRLPALQNA